ncbi:hypothetical protein ACLB2K_003388 [Fragaria x ananassa]
MPFIPQSQLNSKTCHFLWILIYTKFSGPLDSILSKQSQDPLGQFKSIDLSNNMFTGPIDEHIGEEPAMASIKSLILSSNKLTGTIPKQVLDFKDLQELNLSKNQLHGVIPPHKASFPASAFMDNPGLCGAPLSPCNHS